ncbi:hypothetical protein [Agrobacterium burrii]|uniref:CpXC domain-containing protein n=1 Tax=Agrobacterium burrii TaxID=2815339 RepID=A0ABS3EDQ6_9HYPH|nr:hypothetical protein [Agrobacterium burrii]MBO0130088.1 hypothetical protein [Agrobacterium burrii]
MRTVVTGSINCSECGDIVRFECPAPTLPGQDWVSEIEASTTLNEKCKACGAVTTIEVSGHLSSFFAKILPDGHKVAIANEVQYPIYFDPNNGGLEAFYHAQASLEEVIKWLSHKPNPMLHRMYLMQAFSNFEALLSDSLHSFVSRDSAARLAMVERLDGLKDTKFSLAQIEKSPAIVMEKIEKFIETVSFHNFVFVQSIFLTALKVDIFPDTDEDRKFLLSMQQIRHDCVHRNGITQKGRSVEDPLPHLPRLFQIFSDMGNRVQRRIHDKYPPQVA